MNLMFIGKYPPIEGGESSKLYWLAKGLGERGNKITIVSNCQEVEESCRENITAEGLENLKPKNVRLFSTNPLSSPNFIPGYNPYSEKLISLALDCINMEKPDLIIGWYLLPYAVAAHTVSKITRIPHIIQHAGSDIERLFPYEYLNTYLKYILRSADAVLTYGKSQEFLISLGCKSVEKHNVRISAEFNPNGEQINTFEKNKKNLLFLGKPTKYKGIIQLLEAFREIDNEDYQLHLIGQRDIGEYISLCDKRVSFYSAVPPWKIPNILRSVDAYIAPECSFGVQTHTSRIPLEAILCNTRTIISREIATKFPYKELEGLYTKINPLDTKDFAQAIINTLNNTTMPSPSDNQKRLLKELSDFNTYLCDMEKIFSKYAR